MKYELFTCCFWADYSYVCAFMVVILLLPVIFGAQNGCYQAQHYYGNDFLRLKKMQVRVKLCNLRLFFRESLPWWVSTAVTRHLA